MVIVCYPEVVANYFKNQFSDKKTLIFYFDSLGLKNIKCVEIIKQYLVCEFTNKFGNDSLKEKIQNNGVYEDILKKCIDEYYPRV